MILFSIAVPVYNQSSFLRPCLDSICRQMEDDMELLLLDDGSTDGSADICGEYAKKDARIRVFHEPNGGAAAARNRLLSKARGKWLIFADGDDILIDGALKIMREYADATDQLIVFSSRRFWENIGAQKQISDRKDHCVFASGVTDFRAAVLDETFQRALFGDLDLRSVWGKMWNLPFLRGSGVCFLEHLKFGEDMAFNFAATRAMRQIRVVYRCVYGYRQNPASVTMRFSQDAAWICKDTIESLKKDMEDHGEFQSDVLTEAFWKKAGSFLRTAFAMSIQHPDCRWNRRERRERMEEFCRQDWVRETAGHAPEKEDFYAALRMALAGKYKRLERYCRRKRLRYTIVRRLNQSASGRRFVNWYSRQKKKKSYT